MFNFTRLLKQLTKKMFNFLRCRHHISILKKKSPSFDIVGDVCISLLGN